MPTLAELHLATFPTATPPAPLPADRLAAPVSWVRVMKARTPAFDALEAGDLAIVPEGALDLLASGVEEPEALVTTIHGAGASALLLVGEGGDPSARGAAPAVMAQAEALGLPVLRLEAGDATQIERAVIGYLVNARAELDRQAAVLEAQLEQLALMGAGADAYAAAIAAFVGRAVALEDVRGAALAVHASAGPGTAARAAARYLADPREAARRVPLAGAGALVLLGDAPLTELELTVGQRVGPLLALALGHAPPPAVSPRGRRAQGFPVAGPPWVVLMARQLVAGEAGRPDVREALRTRVRRLAGARQLSLRGDADSLELRVIAVPAAADPLGLELAGRIAAAAGRLVAVSRPFERLDERALAEAEARATLEAATVLPAFGAGGPALARADRLAAYRLLGNLPNLVDGQAQARALLAPLLAGRRAAQARQLATLRAVLERPGLAAAAAALGIHRNTLAYRVRGLERLSGWQLDDPDLRLALLIAVRLVQSA